jgi:hypothetical protein
MGHGRHHSRHPLARHGTRAPDLPSLRRGRKEGQNNLQVLRARLQSSRQWRESGSRSLGVALERGAGCIAPCEARAGPRVTSAFGLTRVEQEKKVVRSTQQTTPISIHSRLLGVRTRLLGLAAVLLAACGGSGADNVTEPSPEPRSIESMADLADAIGCSDPLEKTQTVDLESPGGRRVRQVPRERAPSRHICV